MNILLFMCIIMSVEGSPVKSKMPLLDHLHAPLVAELDMADVNSQLKTFIVSEVSDEINKTVSEDIDESIHMEMSKVKSLLKKEQINLKQDMLSRQQNIESKMVFNNTNEFAKIKEKYGSEISESIKQFESKYSEFVKNVMNEISNSIKQFETKFSGFVNNSESVIQEIKGDIKELHDNIQGVGYADCGDLLKIHNSGVYHILNGYDVYCDMYTDGGGWTVIQRRIDGKVDFYRDWKEYKDGFGDLKTEFWLGNDKIHQLTSRGKYELRIDLEDFDGNKAFAKYSSFSIKDENSKYQLSISGYSGNAGDSLDYHNGSKFTTKDKDNDSHKPVNCAVEYKGGWWYKSCHYSNLNGKYVGNKADSKGLRWWHWNNKQSMKTVTIMIRKTD